MKCPISKFVPVQAMSMYSYISKVMLYTLSYIVLNLLRIRTYAN
jgi:hypothetical protein